MEGDLEQLTGTKSVTCSDKRLLQRHGGIYLARGIGTKMLDHRGGVGRRDGDSVFEI